MKTKEISLEKAVKEAFGKKYEPGDYFNFLSENYKHWYAHDNALCDYHLVIEYEERESRLRFIIRSGSKVSNLARTFLKIEEQTSAIKQLGHQMKYLGIKGGLHPKTGWRILEYKCAVRVSSQEYLTQFCKDVKEVVVDQ